MLEVYTVKCPNCGTEMSIDQSDLGSHLHCACGRGFIPSSGYFVLWDRPKMPLCAKIGALWWALLSVISLLACSIYGGSVSLVPLFIAIFCLMGDKSARVVGFVIALLPLPFAIGHLNFGNFLSYFVCFGIPNVLLWLPSSTSWFIDMKLYKRLRKSVKQFK